MEGAVKITSSVELQEKYGDVVQLLVAEHHTAYRLCKALRNRTPPVSVTDGVAKEWFKRYHSDLKLVNSAGHLELLHGDRIRQECSDMNALALRNWLRITLSVDAAVSTCQTWRIKEWSSSGKLLSIQAVEHDIGDRL